MAWEGMLRIGGRRRDSPTRRPASMLLQRRPMRGRGDPRVAATASSQATTAGGVKIVKRTGLAAFAWARRLRRRRCEQPRATPSLPTKEALPHHRRRHVRYLPAARRAPARPAPGGGSARGLHLSRARAQLRRGRRAVGGAAAAAPAGSGGAAAARRGGVCAVARRAAGPQPQPRRLSASRSPCRPASAAAYMFHQPASRCTIVAINPCTTSSMHLSAAPSTSQSL